jgi:predicted acylesterase/phospholipase RssA/CRP-like cAMP-binding protein
MADEWLSREELLSGELNRTRRAAKLLSAIEARCLYMRDESRRVVAAYLVEGDENFERHFDADYVQSVQLTAMSDEALLLDHLERFAAQWRPLVPTDADLRARVLRLIGQKYGLSPSTLLALGGAEQEVQNAYRQLFGDSLEELSSGSAGGPRVAQAESPVATPHSWQDIEARLEWLSLAGGEILYRTGDPGDALYVVISGRLRAERTDEDGSEYVLEEVGRGEMVGEMAVLTGEARSTTMVAVRDSELVRLRRGDLLALSQRHLEVMVRINALLARRLRRQYVRPSREDSPVLALALLPCDSSVPLQQFGQQLAQAVSAFGPTKYITAATLEEGIEPGAAQACLTDPRNSRIVAWLSELEAHYRYLVYEAAPDASEWSQRCLRQADSVVLVGRFGASPQPGAHELAMLAAEAPAQGGRGRPTSEPWRRAARRDPSANRIDLVLLHSPLTAIPVGTARWLGPRVVRSHHHVRIGDPQDMAYLARCLTGHAIGLVLGGGGARGFAHIGVYRALQEAGMTVDLVGGTSMGAIVTGAIGLGMDWQQMREMASGLSSPLKILDPTLPVVSLCTGGKVTGILQKLYGDVLIEDLWRPIFCVSSNLTRSSETVYRHGRLWRAVRASMAIPGIFAPVLHERDVQVDGAVMNNLPIDVMRELGQAGIVIGVNVMPLLDLVKEYRFGDAISGPRAVLSMVNPYDRTSVPMIYETLVRVMALHEAHQEEAKRRLADIYITPPVEKYNILDFGAYDPIIEAGYRTAQEALTAWRGRTGAPVESSAASNGFAVALRRLDSTLTDLERALGAFHSTSS